jgi:transketolase
MLNTELHLNKEIFITTAEKKSTRNGFGDSILKIAKDNDKVVALCADLKDSLKLDNFANQFPERFIEVGIAEQNMAGIAAGLALSGKIPFITSFAIFNPGRNWEQIRLSICYSNTNVKIVGSHAGLSHSKDGGMAQNLEDIALMRVLPRMVVLSPCDYYETVRAVEEAAIHNGPVYIRLCRDETNTITTSKTPFKIGEAYVIKEGVDTTVITTGPILYEALVASKELKGKYGIDVEIINCPTIKPLDEDTILKSTKKTGKVITIEDHQITGGLGGAIAELLSEKYPVPVYRIGVRDKFGESGTYEELKNKYGLSSGQITDKVLLWIKK